MSEMLNEAWKALNKTRDKHIRGAFLKSIDAKAVFTKKEMINE